MAALTLAQTYDALDDADDPSADPVAILDELIRRIDVVNLADELSEEELTKIGSRVVREAKIDDDSRADWKKRTRKGLDLALQENKAKVFPWPNAANIKYPLMTTSALQFNARAYPAIIQGNDVVKAQITGADPGGQKRARGDRIAAHMSWQCLTEMKEWEPGVDSMLMNIPIVGCAFKKTYFSPELGRNCSDYVTAFDCIVNMGAPCLERAPRITHVLSLYPYQIEERFRAKTFKKFEYGSPSPNTDDSPASGIRKPDPDPQDKEAPHEFYEQHRRWDLDGDGYPEPYIVTVHKDTEKVCRIKACYDKSGLIVNPQTGDVIAIEPLQYFTKIPFFPNPDGGFYDVGFAWLFSPLNRAIDTVINQILDAGTLANTGGGFIGSQLRLKGGTLRFSPGQYMEVDVPGGVVKDNIVTLTFPGPSPVLFQMLGLLIESGREVASVKDVLTGENQPANTPATTTLALIEQGLKVFTAIYKRIHRAMKEEFGKLYKLNRDHFDPMMYAAFTDVPEISADDYKGDPIDIIPVADPTMVSDMQRLARAAFLKDYLEMPEVDRTEALQRIFEAAGIANIDKILKPPAGPDPAALAQYAELEAKVANMNADTELMKAQGIQALATAQSVEPAQQLEIFRTFLDTLVAKHDANMDLNPVAKPAAPGAGAAA